MPDATCPVQLQPATTATRGEQVVHFDALRRSGASQRAYARGIGIPSTTLRDWIRRRERTDADPHHIDFFESEAGLDLLHRIFVAALVVMNLQGNCGLRLVGQFFALAGLSPFLASSYGTLQQHGVKMNQLVADFGTQQSETLGKNMPNKRIVVCEDETFPASGMTLVAIEPVSNFILAEQVAPDRKACTWNALLTAAIAPYNVEIVGQCSDEAAALRAHADANDVPHYPDLFHVLHDVNRALVLHLARLHRQATDDADETRIAQVHDWQDAREAAVELIGDVYHPYDVWTGRPASAGEVLTAMNTAFDDLGEVAVQSSASSNGHKQLRKARAVLPSMVLTVAGYHQQVQLALDALELPEAVVQYIEEVALPVAYLRRVAAAKGRADERDALLQRASAVGQGRADLLAGLPQSERAEVQRVIALCAGWFCRSSSCVEGRNGTLSLRQHAHRRLLPSKRAALTVAHNFLSRRADGTTAASRFFEQDHPDLFAWVLQRMPIPPRPAARRASPANPSRPVA